jgi:hypothetical protein
MLIEKSEPGSDSVPPSGPITAEMLCSTREWPDPHLTALALVELARNEKDAPTPSVGERCLAEDRLVG